MSILVRLIKNYLLKLRNLIAMYFHCEILNLEKPHNFIRSLEENAQDFLFTMLRAYTIQETCINNQ